MSLKLNDHLSAVSDRFANLTIELEDGSEAVFLNRLRLTGAKRAKFAGQYPIATTTIPTAMVRLFEAMEALERSPQDEALVVAVDAATEQIELAERKALAAIKELFKATAKEPAHYTALAAQIKGAVEGGSEFALSDEAPHWSDLLDAYMEHTKPGEAKPSES